MPDTLERRIVVARLYDIALCHAGGYREGLTRARALAELATISGAPDLRADASDLLAQAAAAHAVADNWYAITAVGLLIEAGADQKLIAQHVNGIGPDPGPPAG
jgi:hypothetical protein